MQRYHLFLLTIFSLLRRQLCLNIVPYQNYHQKATSSLMKRTPYG